MFFTKILRLISLVYAALCGLVCLGWLFQVPSLIRLDASFVPMSFATSLGLVAASLGLSDYLLFNQRRRPFAAIFLLLWSGIFLFPVETLFKSSFELSQGMSLGGAICLFLFGTSLISVSRERNHWNIIAGSVSCFVGWIGVVGLLGQYVDTDLELSWGAFSQMSLPTAVTVIFLGFTFPVAIYLKNKGDQKFYAFAFFAALLFTSLTMLMEQTIVRMEIQRIRQEINFKSNSVAWEIKSGLLTQHRGFRRMAARLENGTYRSYRDWADDAEGFTRDFKGIQSMHWGDANFILRWIYPVQGNESMIGRDLRKDKPRLKFVEEARRTKRDILSPPWDLLSGSRGTVLYLPLYQGKKYLGGLSVTFRFEDLFPAVLGLKGYSIEIFDGGDFIYRFGSPGRIMSSRWMVKQNVEALNRRWDFNLVPDVATLKSQSSFVPTLVLVLGFFISIAISLAVFFYLTTRQAERKSREFLQWQNAVMGGSPLMILSSDENMMIKSLNRTGEKLIGYSEQEAIGRYIPDLLHAEQGEEYQEFLKKIRRGEVTSAEWIYVSRYGREFRGTVVVSPLYDEQHRLSGFVSLIEDVTEKRTQEARMLTSARLASLGEMAAGIAHEINNPLTIIGAHAASVRRSLSPEQEPALRKLEAIERTVQRIAKIIRGLRSFAREVSQEEKTEVSLKALIDETLSFSAERFRNADIELEVSVDEKITIVAQEHQLSQVLLNLLNNAYDATVNAENKRVFLSVMAVDGGVEISVEDSGSGVAVELREKIMQPFFTTKEAGEGLGLGLSISRGIISSHGGKFYLDTDAKRTRFVIWLPA